MEAFRFQCPSYYGLWSAYGSAVKATTRTVAGIRRVRMLININLKLTVIKMLIYKSNLAIYRFITPKTLQN